MKSLAYACATLAAALVATGATAKPAAKPKLIVTISVDQFSADVFAEYRPMFKDGLKRMQDGMVFPSGYQSHAATETCPGHSTILTGSHPARTGIIANNWFDLTLKRADKKVYCSEDTDAPGSDSDNYVVSPKLLKMPTLGDRMKKADPQARVVSVAGKDRAAVMMGGHDTDQIWFWGGKGYVTLPDRAGLAPPPAVARVNARVADVIARPHPAHLPAQCRTRSRAVTVTETRQVGQLADRKAEDFSGFRAAVDFDAATTDLAIAMLKDMKLGQGASTDLLIVGLSATDYVGHGFGTSGAEMCAQMVGLDANIGRLFAALDASGIPYAVALTADHGGHDLPERNRQRGFPDAQRADTALLPGNFSKAMSEELGLKLNGPLFYSDGPFGDWYLSLEIPAADRPRILQTALARLLSHPQIAAVLTKEELRRVADPAPPVEEWDLAQRARASFDPERSGDLVVLLKPHVTPITNPGRYVATHGSPWIYDRRVPIIFYRSAMPGFEQPLSIETVDILPTLAALIDLPIAAGEIDGRCIDLDVGIGSTCK